MRTSMPVIGVALVWVLMASCSSDPGTQPNGNVTGLVPDFSLQDVNFRSPTYEQQVSLSSLEGQIVILFFGDLECTVCTAQFGGVREVAADLENEGLMGLTLMWVNPHIADWQVYQLEANPEFWGTFLSPVLQDVLENETNKVGSLLNCTKGKEVVIIDRVRHLHRKVESGLEGEAEINLETTAGQDSLAGWIREIDA